VLAIRFVHEITADYMTVPKPAFQRTMKRAASSAEPESYDTISDEDDSSVSSTDGKPSYVTNEPLETTRNDQTREETREKSETSSINETSLPPAGDPDEMADESIGDSESSPVSNKKQRRGKPVIKDGKPYGLLQAKWDEMFARLEAYKAKHGNCLVPNRYKGDASLGAWVSTQRRQYKILTTGSYESTPMTPDRAQRLEALGFIWATKDPRHVPWERRFQELVAFKKKYGVSFEIPSRLLFIYCERTFVLTSHHYSVHGSTVLFQSDMR
jgi:hypothetical protein